MMTALNLFAIMMAILVPLSLPFIVSKYMDNKKKTEIELGKLRKQIDENSVNDLQKELAAVKERVAVLEAIVTDRGYEVERKISNL